MTNGNIWRVLVVYAFPVFLGELFQTLYNTVDTIILGNFVSADAMAAVGGTGSVTKLLVGFFNGISIGCTVVIARFFGEKNEHKVQESVHTILYMMFFFGIVLSLIGVGLTEPVLRFLSIPKSVLPYAILYIKIYFGGLLGLVMYNTVAGILRAIGDSKRPFYLLLLSSLLNIGLDLLFVIRYQLGVAGVAYATIIAQGISAIVSILLLIFTKEKYRFQLIEGGLNSSIMLEVLKIGIPTGIQKMLTSFSNVVVLSYISFFGEGCLAAWAVYTKVNHFVVVGMQSMGSAIMTFVSQNNGAKQYQRANEGIRIAFRITVVFSALVSIVIYVFAEPIVHLFGNYSEMFLYARMFLSTLVLFQIVHVPMTFYAAVLRGMGKAVSSTVCILFGLIVVRQLYLLIITSFINTPFIVGLSFPVGWAAAGGCLYWKYCKERKNKK